VRRYQLIVEEQFYIIINYLKLWRYEFPVEEQEMYHSCRQHKIKLISILYYTLYMVLIQGFVLAT